ncbi:nuclease [Microbacterium hydrothermale]|uniref:nuclease n=1 Tax=Microbacterium hydrothermale TaxID=857427 RepID=UPI001F0E43B3|nr:nuclease [Microbacterium hydrothermale]
MAASNPSAWWDGLVVDADGTTVTVALLTGATVTLRVVGPAVDIAVSEPVAYHPVAELLSASAILTTARAA